MNFIFIKEEIFTNNLFTKVYKPSKSGVYPLVIFSHGLLSSSDEFGTELPQILSRNGIASLLFDFSGHGKSKGIRGNISLKSIQSDIKEIIDYANNLDWVDKNSIFGLGHSLGTIPILANYAYFKGLILAAPPSRIKDSLNIFEKIAYPLIYYLLAAPFDNVMKFLGLNKYFYLPYKFKKKHLFRNKDLAIKSDFELQRFIPANFYTLIQNQDSIALAKKVENPTIIIAAKFDKATGILDAKRIYAALKTTDKKLLILENSGHSIFWDQEKDKTINKIVEWIKEKTIKQ